MQLSLEAIKIQYNKIQNKIKQNKINSNISFL